MMFDDDSITYLQNRLVVVIGAVLLFFVIIVIRLYTLQVVQGPNYSRLATEVAVREDEVVARRGKITDRHGKVLADTRVYFEVTITPQYVSDIDQVVESLTRLLPVEKDLVLENYKSRDDGRRYHPIIVMDDVPYEWAAKLSEHLSESYGEDSPYDLSGVDVNAFPLRRYLYPELFSHVLGYLREISREQLDNRKRYPKVLYSRGDLIGASGLEKQYDPHLKGRDGRLARVVDARGREVPFSEDVRVMKEKISQDPRAGFHLKTTMDFNAQKAAMESFPEGKKGAVVAIEPVTGEVLVLYSHPGFDANRLVKNIDNDYWKALVKTKGLYNLATQGTYPPASTYKPVGIVAGIEEGIIKPEETKHRCPGGWRFGGRFFRCWKKSGHGVVDAVLSLGQSCDVFFYKVGVALGVDKLSEYARLFGFDQLTGIDFPVEKGGLIPTKAWKEKRFKQEWIESETLSVSIGQSYNLVTPLQLAKMVGMIANSGYEVKPHLGQQILDHEGGVIRKFDFERKRTKLVEHEAMHWVKKGMEEVVHGRGTAKKLRNSPHKIAGKTGTAQVFRMDRETKKLIELEDHGLFIGYAPMDSPQIAVAVVVEHGGGGSSAAAPVAMKVIDAYLGLPEEGEADD